MNILYVHCHDGGRFIEPYGYPIPAPNLQSLAERGTLFRQAFSPAATCSPSRAALYTGQYPHCCGMHGLATAHSGYTLNDYGRTLANFLQGQGYLTALAGVQHVAHLPWADPKSLGYERFLYQENNDQFVPNTALASTLSFLNGKHERPFFLSVGFNEPHRYKHAPNLATFSAFEPEAEASEARYCRPLPLFPDNDVTRKETANFKRGVHRLDRQIGAIIDELEKNRLMENTLIMCTTDHGAGFPAMKASLTDWGTGVFLILSGPGGFTGGRIVDGMVTHMDLYPTICALLGVQAPAWLQGKSLLPLITGGQQEIHEEIFAEQGYHDNYCPLRSIRTNRYKLIRCFYTEPGESHYSADHGPTYRLWMDHGYADRKMPEYQLYDLVFDPAERCNLANDEDHREVLASLKLRLERWMKETNDPLLHGGIPPPPCWKPGQMTRSAPAG